MKPRMAFLFMLFVIFSYPFDANAQVETAEFVTYHVLDIDNWQKDMENTMKQHIATVKEQIPLVLKCKEPEVRLYIKIEMGFFPTLTLRTVAECF